MKKPGPKIKPIAERFWAKVPDQPGMDCWEWAGALDTHGYGRIQYRPNEDSPHRAQAAHRIAYMLCKGDPGDLFVCHACDNPPCVNPNHLFLGTQSDNMQDAVSKGRRIYTRQTHCKRGHEFTSENTGIDHRGDRFCRTCMDANQKRHRELRRSA